MNARLLMGVALFMSLAANAFLAGWLLSPRPQTPDAIRGSEAVGPLRALGRELRALPEKERVQAVALLRDYAPKLRQQVKALRVARAAARELLSSEGYSRPEAEARFARVREESEKLQSLAQRMTLDLADRLPAAQRAALLERLSRSR